MFSTRRYRQYGKIHTAPGETSCFTKDLFRKFEKGQKVVIKPEPSYQKSIPHKRYFSKTAVITKKQGACYEVALKIGNQPKKIIVHPVHLVKVK